MLYNLSEVEEAHMAAYRTGDRDGVIMKTWMKLRDLETSGHKIIRNAAKPAAKKKAAPKTKNKK